MDPRMNPHGSKNEYNWAERDGREPNTPGVYYHPQADKFIETAFTVDFRTGQPVLQDGERVYDRINGKVQADAFVQVGYRKATPEEVKQYRIEQAELSKKLNAVAKATGLTTKI